MNKKKTLAVGIPAYNEEVNIKSLLEVLLEQKEESFSLEEIIVVSDVSTDNTVKEARSVDDNRVKVTDAKIRRGVVGTQNFILSKANADILVLLDADTLPADNSFLEEIIDPIAKDKNVALVGADVIPAEAKGVFEKIISYGHLFRRDMFGRIRGGNNIYNCSGRARAFSKFFYKDIVWPLDYCEDTFSYLYCVKKGFKFVSAQKAKILFRSPSNLKDHLKQSLRFVDDRKEQEQNFGAEFVKSEFSIPFEAAFESLINFLAKNPFLMVSYILILIYARLLSLRSKDQQHSLIDPPTSTKRV